MTKTKQISIFVAVLALAFPYKTTVEPSRNILVVTRGMRPISGILVRQSWKNYSLESDGNEEDRYTDHSGRVSFPQRSIRRPLILRIILPAINFLSQGLHATY